jgi:hypothetical protein
LRWIARTPLSATSGVKRRGFKMNPRLLFSVALIAVLFCYWLLISKPMCQDGLVVSLGPRLQWTCAAAGG